MREGNRISPDGKCFVCGDWLVGKQKLMCAAVQCHRVYHAEHKIKKLQRQLSALWEAAGYAKTKRSEAK